MTLHSLTENSLAVLNHKILEANSQVQNVKLGGHQTCLSINRLWHELCDMLRRLVGTTAPGHREAAVVQIKISVLNINFVDEEKQSFGVDIFFHQVWKDPRLRIPPTHNVSRLVLDSKWRTNLWTPDTYFKKLVDGKVNDIIIPYSYMVVDSESYLFFASR
ncbi:gamma-aminobutyric acid receptor subunit theta [Trichonephila clavipes]|uniref:Gamma-aminobutyric acid receptor subunit theta n=1 Tax=Trichonephila clavipes TaxID=2585209 RepID=A0A8X6UXE1_TRICX|nr:gamma-aminobutyric acid receptor subunit theta [Trichonephila clavipes]